MVDFPNAPTDGQIHSEQNMSWRWVAVSSAWQVVQSGQSVTIAESGASVGENWQVWGDTLIQWGRVAPAAGEASQVVTYPKAFKENPTVTISGQLFGASDTQTMVPHVDNVSTTSFDMENRWLNGASGPAVPGFGVQLHWTAVGPALDEDRKPSTVGVLGGSGGGGGASVFYGASKPVGVPVNSLWYCTVDPVGLYLLTDDGDSQQWVMTNVPVLDGEYVPKAGGTFDGEVTVTQVFRVDGSDYTSMHINDTGLGSPRLYFEASGELEYVFFRDQTQDSMVLGRYDPPGTYVGELARFWDTGSMEITSRVGATPVWMLLSNSANGLAYRVQGHDQTNNIPMVFSRFDNGVYNSILASLNYVGTSMPRVDTIVTREKGDTRYASASSKRFKTGIATQTGGHVGKLAQLQPKAFTWGGELPPEDERVGQQAYGLIAEEVAAVLPQAVTYQSVFYENTGDYNRDGKPTGERRVHGLDPLALIGVLIDEVKALQARVEVLENG